MSASAHTLPLMAPSTLSRFYDANGFAHALRLWFLPQYEGITDTIAVASAAGVTTMTKQVRARAAAASACAGLRASPSRLAPRCDRCTTYTHDRQPPHPHPPTTQAWAEGILGMASSDKWWAYGALVLIVASAWLLSLIFHVRINHQKR